MEKTHISHDACNDTKPNEDKPVLKITGEWRDIIRHSGEIIATGDWQHNIIVNSINVLIACLMKNDYDIKGITHWAVGEGESTWDPINPDVTLDPTRTTLFCEIGRKPIDSISFINEYNEIVDTRTNRILVIAKFEPNECTGVWREFALFGGEATDDLNTGIMLDHKVHQMYVKTNDVTVERQIRFIFE